MSTDAKEWFTYGSAPIAALAPAAATSRVIQIQADTPFVWMATSYMVDVAGAAQTDASRVLPLVEITIFDSGSGKQLMNVPVPIPAMAGAQGLPSLLSPPKIFVPSASIQINFRNYGAVTYNNLAIFFIGYKEYDF